jgi:hypothetical protein
VSVGQLSFIEDLRKCCSQMPPQNEDTEVFDRSNETYMEETRMTCCNAASAFILT